MRQNNTAKDPKPLLLPVLPIMFAATYLWAAWYYGDVLVMARERSFWVASTEQMDFLLSQEFGGLWYVGRMLMMLYVNPWIGALPLAAMITWSTWCLGYSMRLTARWRWLQYLPAGAFMAFLSYEGVNLFFENEAGAIMGIPFCTTVILSTWAALVASFSRKKSPAIIKMPHDENRWQNLAQLGALAAAFGTSAIITEVFRPYTRVMADMNVSLLQKDWQAIMKTARDNAEISTRPIAATYAIALVKTGQQCDRMYDISLNYDSMYIHRKNCAATDNALPLYQENCDYYAGFVQTCIHHAVERMTMIGPNILSLHLLTKCALLTGETEVARKYLRILRDVPFESDFVEKYSAYITNPELIETDSEMAHIRKLEPIHDNFENMYQLPVFLGYNIALTEGRSKDALLNSLAVCMYSKSIPAFMDRVGPLKGTLLPENVADALCLCSAKDEGILNRFSGLEYRLRKLANAIAQFKPYMQEREKNAPKLFEKYKGYYPYYYYFGNLKATRKSKAQDRSGTAGVN